MKGQSKTLQIQDTNDFELEFVAKNIFIGAERENYVNIDLTSKNSRITFLSLRSNGASNEQWRRIDIKDISGYGILDDLKKGMKFKMKVLFEMVDDSSATIKYWLNGAYKRSEKIDFAMRGGVQIVFSELMGQSFSFSKVTVR